MHYKSSKVKQEKIQTSNKKLDTVFYICSNGLNRDTLIKLKDAK